MDKSQPELFIDGRFRAASGTEPVIEAATERPLGQGSERHRRRHRRRRGRVPKGVAGVEDYNGQMCVANTRVLAPRSRYSEIVDALGEMAGSLVVGDPLDERVDIGPLVSARQRERVLGYIEAGKAEGARLVTGGGIPADRPRGWYVTPTVFADVDNSARIAREEIFGPVVAVIPYDSDGEAVAIANDSDFGLGGTVWSSDEVRATEIARAMHTGTVGINHYEPDLDAPFGGVKGSGIGRKLGPEGLATYQTVKSIYRVGAPAAYG